MAFTLCRFMRRSSSRTVSAGTWRPQRGWCSCRFTPRSWIGAPLTRNTPSAMSIVRKPIRIVTDSVSVQTRRV